MPRTRDARKRHPKTIAVLALLAVTLVGVVVGVSGIVRPDPPGYSPNYTPPPVAVAPEDVPVDLSTVKTAMFIGDALTFGIGAEPVQAGFAYVAAERLGVRPVVWGFGGTGFVNRGPSATGNYQERFANVGITEMPDLIVVQGGRNDASASPADIRTKANEFVDLLQSKFPRAQIVLMGPEIVDLEQRTTLSPVNGVIREVADEQGLRFVNPMGENWLTRSNLWGNVVYQEGLERRLSNEGHAYFADRLLASMRGSSES